MPLSSRGDGKLARDTPLQCAFYRYECISDASCDALQDDTTCSDVCDGPGALNLTSRMSHDQYASLGY